MVPAEEHINFLEHLEDIQQQLLNREVFLFLDYDGTLTPIVDTPDMAVLSTDMQDIVQSLSQKYKVAVVSGRATHDVRSKVLIDQIYYAGSHGFEIVHPNQDVMTHPDVQEVRATILEVYEQLLQELKHVSGALVEDVKYTISVHYRLVSDEDFPKIDNAVENILTKYPQLRKTSGKKVFELRPQINWHKGKAVEWILKDLNFDAQKNIAILYR